MTCEHDARRVTRTEFDGTITVLIDKFDGKPLNSPNDVVSAVRRLDLVHRSAVRHSGQLRRTRPRRSCPPTSTASDAKTGQATIVAGDINRPNGLAFSPDESKMYIVEAAVTPRVI